MYYSSSSMDLLACMAWHSNVPVIPEPGSPACSSLNGIALYPEGPGYEAKTGKVSQCRR